MTEEQSQKVMPALIRGRPIPGGGGEVSDGSWRILEGEKARKKEAEAAEKRVHRACRQFVAEPLLTALFDLSSHGLGHKLGLAFQLDRFGNAAIEQYQDLIIVSVGHGNFYASPLVRRLVANKNVTARWFAEEMDKPLNPQDENSQSRRDRLLELYDLSFTRTAGGWDSETEMQRAIYLDLYCMYEMANLLFGVIVQEFPRIVEPETRLQRQIHKRNLAWRQNPLLRGLGENFWRHQNQPTLGELMIASYQLLGDMKDMIQFEGKISEPWFGVDKG